MALPGTTLIIHRSWQVVFLGRSLFMGTHGLPQQSSAMRVSLELLSNDPKPKTLAP